MSNFADTSKYSKHHPNVFFRIPRKSPKPHQVLKRLLKFHKPPFDQFYYGGNAGYEYFSKFLEAYGVDSTDAVHMTYDESDNLKRFNIGVMIKDLAYFEIRRKGNDLDAMFATLQDEPYCIDKNFRFVLLTNTVDLLAYDTETGKKLTCAFSDLPANYEFFLPLIPFDRNNNLSSYALNSKRTKNTKIYYDFIKPLRADNDYRLNIFSVLLAYCFHAEQVGIFEANQFTLTVKKYATGNGDELKSVFSHIFTALNTPVDHRDGLPDYAKAFPYVGSELFCGCGAVNYLDDDFVVPDFNGTERDDLLDIGGEEWGRVETPVFKLMIDDVKNIERSDITVNQNDTVQDVRRVALTSFKHKLLSSFRGLDRFYHTKAIEQARIKLSNIHIFDPDCDSGFVLCLAYKELCDMERTLMQHYPESFKQSCININNFHGISHHKFSCKIAKLSLWTAHWHEIEFFKLERRKIASQSLNADSIVHGNAINLDWQEVCPALNDVGEPLEVHVISKLDNYAKRQLAAFKSADKALKGDIGDVEAGKINKQPKTPDYFCTLYQKAGEYLNDKSVATFLCPSRMISIEPNKLAFKDCDLPQDVLIGSVTDVIDFNKKSIHANSLWVSIRKNPQRIMRYKNTTKHNPYFFNYYEFSSEFIES